jgi:hypothetical protein
MNATLEQIKPETLELLEKQAAKFELSVDDYLRRLLPHGENELALKAETSDEITTSEESAEEKEIKRQKSIAWIKSHVEEYGGKYVALDGDKLIGTGERYGDALKLALQAGYKKAFIGFIHPPNYRGYMGGWD